jgi:hypothetical protein
MVNPLLKCYHCCVIFVNGGVLVVTLLFAAEPLKFYFVENSSRLLPGFGYFFCFLNCESIFSHFLWFC